MNCPSPTPVHPESLKPHPVNQDVYGDDLQLDEAFCNDIAENGVLEYVVASEDGHILSGHRRTAAAVKGGLQEIPCVFLGIGHNHPEAIHRLFQHNLHRRKSNEMLARECWHLRENLNRRQEEGLPPIGGRTSELISSHCDWSQRTVERALSVIDHIKELEDSEESHRAIPIKEALQRSVNAACELIKEIEDGEKAEMAEESPASASDSDAAGEEAGDSGDEGGDCAASDGEVGEIRESEAGGIESGEGKKTGVSPPGEREAKRGCLPVRSAYTAFANALQLRLENPDQFENHYAVLAEAVNTAWDEFVEKTGINPVGPIF